MVPISTIGSPAEVRVAQAQPSDDRVQRADVEIKQVDRTPEISPPQGVRKVINNNKENDLQRHPVTETEVRELVSALQETVDKAAKDLHRIGFRQDYQTKTYIIEIKDQEGNLVKQFPPEKVLNQQRKLDELSGMVIDEMI